MIISFKNILSQWLGQHGEVLFLFASVLFLLKRAGLPCVEDLAAAKRWTADCLHSSPWSVKLGSCADRLPVPGLAMNLGESNSYSQKVHFLPRGLPWWLSGKGGLSSKESACNVGNPGSIPGLGGSSGGGNGHPLQYSCLENPMNRGSLIGYSSWGQIELATTERRTHFLPTSKEMLSPLAWQPR